MNSCAAGTLILSEAPDALALIDAGGTTSRRPVDWPIVNPLVFTEIEPFDAIAKFGTTTLNTLAINADPSAKAALWRIGNWDGTPAEFLNGSRLTTMHPSDVRMSSWVPSAYVIGSSNAASGFPAYQWKDVNNARVIRFNLTSAQVQNLKLRIGTTADFNGARPQVTVNSWTSAIPTAPSKGSRNLTVGTYRGVNRLYSFDIPASALVAGTNTVTINIVSGTTGTAYLSPGMSYDAVDLVTP